MVKLAQIDLSTWSDLELADSILALEEIGEVDSSEYNEILNEMEKRFKQANKSRRGLPVSLNRIRR